MKRKILLIGAGGHCKVVLDLLLRIKEYEIAGIIDLRERVGAKVLGISVIGTDADLPRFFKSGIKHCFISIGSIGDPSLRVKLYNLAKKTGFAFPNLISHNALISFSVIMGEGNYIAPGVIINAGAQLGNNCIVNTGVIIEHDCNIGDFVHISPGSVLSGGVSIGINSHIGMGSTIIQNVKIGERSIIGAGSVVTKNIRKGVLVYGNPCKERKMRKVFIIAEAGVNHNGSTRTAKKMVDVAVSAGADAVKFQTFNAESLVSKYAPKAKYQKIAIGKDESQLKMIKKLELDLNAHKELLRYCSKKKIIFLSSPFDLKSIDLLAHMGSKIFKIPSGEITNLPYLRKVGSLRKKIIMSTGMANLEEINDAVDVLIKNGTKKGNITVLHCNTEYPTPFKDANLFAMLTIKDRLGVQVGYSDHTVGIEVAIAAVALGASVIEKHFTLDKDMSGPDHKASLDPKELRNLVASIRNIEMALGSGIKKPSVSESINIRVVRKSIVAGRDIKRGEFFDENNLAVKRPGTGISPMKWDYVLGKIAKKDFYRDELIKI